MSLKAEVRRRAPREAARVAAADQRRAIDNARAAHLACCETCEPPYYVCPELTSILSKG